MANKTINIPDLGEAEDVEVIEICAKVGDQVDSEDPIIVLESDKAAILPGFEILVPRSFALARVPLIVLI